MIIDKRGEITNVNDLHNIETKEQKQQCQKVNSLSLFEPKLDELYNKINQNHILHKGTIKKSWRKFIGFFINIFKKLLNRLLYPSFANLFEIQNEFNSTTTQLLNTLREKINYALIDMHDKFSNNFDQTNLNIEQVDKKLLELNHHRYMEIKNIENYLHNEFLNLKTELANIIYTYIFLQKNVQELISKYEIIDNKIVNLDNRIKQEIVNLDNRIKQERVDIDNKIVNLDNRIKQEIEKIKIQLIGLSQLKESLAIQSYKQSSVGEVSDGENLLEDTLYFNLEDKLRGDENEIAYRQYRYIEYLRNNMPVLDVGCGRGEMLTHLKNNGIEAIGIDSNQFMVDYCLSKNLKVIRASAISYLSRMEDNSLGAIFAAHFIEHLYPKDLLIFLSLSFNKLKKDGILIIETPNVLGLYTLSQSFYLDITHMNPVHPHTLKLILELLGFKIIDSLMLSQWDDDTKLASLPSKIYNMQEADLFQLIDKNFSNLNKILFAPRDYAIIARK